jgi:hypothetical protein
VDALDVLKVCLRRWYVVLPVVLLSLAAGLGLASQQKPTYTAVGSYALVYHSPAHVKEGEDPTEPNPLATNGAVVLGEALVADFMSGASQTTFGGVGNSGTAPREPRDGTSYTVDLPDGSQSYVVQTWGKDPESLRRVVDSVLAAAPGRTAQIQDRAGAPKKSQYTTFVTGSTQLTRLPSTSTTKLIVAMLGVGILAGSALSLIVDRLSRSRKERAARRVPQVHQRSVDEVLPDARGSDMVMKFPTPSAALAQPYENAPEPIAAAAADLKSKQVPADRTEGASVDTAKRLPADELKAASANLADQVPADQSEDVSVVDAAEMPADQASEMPADQVAVPLDDTMELPVVRAGKAAPNKAHEVPVHHAVDGAKDQAPVNYPNGEQRHEPERRPLTEYRAEPDFARVNHDSLADSDSWPLLDHQRELDAEGAANDHTRDRQPTH